MFQKNEASNNNCCEEGQEQEFTNTTTLARVIDVMQFNKPDATIFVLFRQF